MNRHTRLRSLRTVAAIAMLAPLAALAQGGPPPGDDDHGQHGPQQQQHDNHGPQGGPQGAPQGDRGHAQGNGPQGHGPDNRGPQGNGPQHDDARYDFRDQDRTQLQQHYRNSLKKVDRSHRPQFEAGREIPNSYRRYVTPAPASVRAHLPKPPSGYTVGYYQGYTVVYDPTTYVILSVLDLLTQ